MFSKKIGVFGDSFAESKVIVPHQSIMETQRQINLFNNSIFKTWIDLLDADSYGLGGTDLYYSFMQFEKYHQQYEQVIFVLTNSNNRLTFMHDYWEEDNRGPNDDNAHSTSIEMANNEANKYAKPKDDNSMYKHHMYSKIANWHELHVHNGFTERENTFAKLILDKVTRLRPDAKIIKGFHWYDPNTNENILRPEVHSLLDLVKFENTILGWDKDLFPSYDVRPAHFTNETHSILTGLIEKWLETKTTFFYFNLEDFKNIKPDEKMYSTKQGINTWVNYITKNYNNDK